MIHSSTPPTISFQGMRVEQLIKWSCFLSTPQMGCIWEFFMHNAQEVHWHDLNGTKKMISLNKKLWMFPHRYLFGVWIRLNGFKLIRMDWIGNTIYLSYLISLLFHRSSYQNFPKKIFVRMNSSIAAIMIISFKAKFSSQKVRLTWTRPSKKVPSLLYKNDIWSSSKVIMKCWPL